MRPGSTKHATKLQPDRTVNNRDISISPIIAHHKNLPPDPRSSTVNYERHPAPTYPEISKSPDIAHVKMLLYAPVTHTINSRLIGLQTSDFE